MTARLRTLLTAAIMLALVTLIGSPADSYSGYGDVDADAYHAPAIAWMKGERITTGTSEGCFSPDDSITRAEFVELRDQVFVLKFHVQMMQASEAIQ